VAREAAAEFERAALAACARQGAFRVALAGGTTPRETYALLSDARAPHRQAIPWPQVHVFFCDERQVAPDSRLSNIGMACETLLRHVPIPEGQIHRMRGENPDPDRAAEEYEEILRDAFRIGPRELPRFDLILLGMGEDGHTASLFPGSQGLDEKERLAIATRAPVEPAGRITLTLPVLNAAAEAMVLVTGAGKASAFARVRAGGADLPAARLRPENGTLVWLADRAAAGGSA
jgi:6-phosphogluconolactonase